MPEQLAAAPQRRWAGGLLTWGALTGLVLLWGAALAAMLWLDLSAPEREQGWRLLQPRRGLLFLLVLALPLLLGLVLRPWLAAWPRTARRLSEEVAIVAGAHAGHRVQAVGPREMRDLAAAIDQLGQAHAALRRDVDAQVERARAELATETRRLAALMSELTVAVLVCHRDGRVLLYNARAAALLGAQGELGLGRPVGALLDAAALAQAWGQVSRRHEQGLAHEPAAAVAPAAAHFVTALRRGAAAGNLLRVQMVPTLDEGGVPGGYVLLVDDITRSVLAQGRRDALLRGLTEGLRAALGNLRAAAQALQQYPAMDADRRAGLSAVVHEEAERLARQLREAASDAGVDGETATAWPLADVLAGDLVWALQRALAAGAVAVECRFDGAGARRWLRIDSHAIVQLLAGLARRLHDELQARELTVEVAGAPTTTRIDLRWRGAPLAPGTLDDWERQPSQPDAAGSTAGLRVVLDRHGAELWSAAAPSGQASGESSTAPSADPLHRLCLQFGRAPAAPDAAAASLPAALRHRPVAYDFDLFHQAGQNERLDETALAALSFTVFDTETTGLRPSDGDEIIALGAVRIVNGRVLEHECFERRVRPRRPVRASAEAVHGISTAALAHEPPLEEVLPAFARFCEDTVLVAHNAAFDMRFLELARERTGLRFDHPVLDTMLLSAVVLPGHGSDEHHLEQIAARLGVPVVGRHQALGDANTTARAFLKLLSLLAERGVTTLGQARAASKGVEQAHETY